MFDKDLHDCLFRYVQSLNLPPVTNTMNARNYVESDREELKKEEEDDKSISLGMPCNPKKRMKKEKWRKNGVATHLQLPTMVFL